MHSTRSALNCVVSFALWIQNRFYESPFFPLLEWSHHCEKLLWRYRPQGRYILAEDLLLNRDTPGEELETKCYPWDFSPISNVMFTQLSPGDSHLFTPKSNLNKWVAMTFKIGEKYHEWHLVSISTPGPVGENFRVQCSFGFYINIKLPLL